MSQRARISLSGEDSAKVDSVCAQIKGISQRTGVDIRGPVPLPTKKLRVPCRKSPDGEGSETWDHWEKRIHKRLIDLDADERALRQLMRIQVPDGVNIEIVPLNFPRRGKPLPLTFCFHHTFHRSSAVVSQLPCGYVRKVQIRRDYALDSE